VHLGKELPNFLPDCVKQITLFNKNCDIYLLANESALEYSNFDELKYVKTIPVETIEKSAEHIEFLRNCRLDKSFRDGFWLFTSERFLYIYDFMLENNLEDVFHIENDVMLYVNLDDLMPIFKVNYKSMAAIFDNDERCIPSFVYFSNKDAVKKLVQYFSVSDNTDMYTFGYCKKNSENVIQNLPIIMTNYLNYYPLKSSSGLTTKKPEDFFNNFNLFNSIFDAACIGQYLGGIDPRNADKGPGFINESCLFNPSNFTFEWKLDDKGRRVPYAVFKGSSYRINNIHVHSKNLKNFLSIS
jgi:hypothetical protein